MADALPAVMVRDARPTDLDAFVDLWGVYLADDSPDTDPTEHNLEIVKGLFKAVVENVGVGVCLVLEDHDGLAGGLLWGIIPEGGLDSGMGRTAQGFGTYVIPAYRCQGWARKMWLRAIKELRRLKVDTIAVAPHVGNEASLKGLESVGFHPYQVLMVKRLGKEN